MGCDMGFRDNSERDGELQKTLGKAKKQGLPSDTKKRDRSGRPTPVKSCNYIGGILPSMDPLEIFYLLGIVAEFIPNRSRQGQIMPPIDQAKEFRRVAGVCPACTEKFAGHHYVPLASTWTDDGLERDAQLWTLLDEQRWDEVRTIAPGPKGSGLMAAYAYRCPTKRRAGWFTMFFSVDATDLPFRSGIEVLNREDSEGLAATVDSGEWRPFR